MRILLAVAAVALLGACNTVEDFFDAKKVDYKSAGKLPPLDVPPDLTAPSRDNRYAVPDTGKSATTLSGYQAERAQARPGAGTVLPSAEGVRVERDGNQRWLVVNEPPDKLWPLVKEFWQESGFLLRQDVRVFRLDRVRDATPEQATFTRPQDFDSLAYVLDSLATVTERDRNEGNRATRVWREGWLARSC